MDVKRVSEIIIFASTISIFFAVRHAQRIQYATRFRNFTIWSENGCTHLVSMKINGNHLDDYIAAKVNVTRDVHLKYAVIQLNRCSYEKSACEHFLKIVVDKNMKEYFYAKNQIWSSAIRSYKPPLDFPIVKKAMYETERMVVNAAEAVAFYSDAFKYYFQIDGRLFDFNNEIAVGMWTEVSFHSFVKRNRNRNRGNSSTKS